MRRDDAVATATPPRAAGLAGSLGDPRRSVRLRYSFDKHETRELGAACPVLPTASGEACWSGGDTSETVIAELGLPVVVKPRLVPIRCTGSPLGARYRSPTTERGLETAGLKRFLLRK